MIESQKSLISTFSKLDISQKKFGDRSSILSNLSKIGYPIVEGFFISYDIMKQIEIGQQTPQIPYKFLECGPFCLRSSTNKTENSFSPIGCAIKSVIFFSRQKV